MIYGSLTKLSISLKLKREIFVLLTNVCSYRTLGTTSLNKPEYSTKHTKPNYKNTHFTYNY